MRNTLLVIVLIAALIAAPVHAQEPYTHQPQLRTIIDASDCDTVQLPGHAQSRLPKAYIPTLRNGRPQTPQCPPDVYANAIALDGTQYTITPITRDGFAGFDGTSTHDIEANYSLSQTLTYTEAVELFGGEAPADGIYREVRYAFAVEDAGDLVYASQDEPIEGPANLRDVHNANKSATLDQWIKTGKLRSIALSGSTPLRVTPTTVIPGRSMHQLCPHLAHLPTYTVELVSAVPLYDFSPQGWTVLRVWVQVRHSQEISDACPAIQTYRMVEGPAFFQLMGPELEMQLEGQTTIAEVEWRQKIILQPLEVGGQAIEATAAFIATPHGQALIITIVILTATAVFVGPQVWVLILV